MVPINYYIILSAILFTIGVAGVLIRRNALIIFMSIELMLNAANLAMVAFSSVLTEVSADRSSCSLSSLWLQRKLPWGLR